MFSKAITLAFTISLFAPTILGLGINCRGANECSIHQSETANGLYRIAQILNTTMDDQMYYDDGSKIACLPGAKDQNKGNGGLCAYLQNGANATGAELKVLVKKLQEHGCKKCGSIPTLVTQGINNVSKGELTVNWNSHANGCNGTCPPPDMQK